MELHGGIVERLPDNRNNGAQMFTGSQLGHDAAVFGMGMQLRGDYAGTNAPAVFDDGSGSFVA